MSTTLSPSKLAAGMRAKPAPSQGYQPGDGRSATETTCLVGKIAEMSLVSRSEDELARFALELVRPLVSAGAVAVQWCSTAELGMTEVSQRRPRSFSVGDLWIDNVGLKAVLEQLRPGTSQGTLIDNAFSYRSPRPPHPTIRGLVLVPLRHEQIHYGWLVAMNHAGGGFGARESELLSTVASLLSTHRRNRELHREQSELVTDVVRALVSAIDAKDPYTSGHSDRVARIAVRIALEMRYDPTFVKFVYLAGLLHDVGKIGISDAVLSKAGKLTEAEFEQIKMHPQLGCKILADLRPLSAVLPAVRHHHERWDGGGYPDHLAAHQIPAMARIVAVADAYDAMTTNRPYQQGLTEDEVNCTLREGAGKQWDLAVVNALFAAKDDILAIAGRHRPRVEAVADSSFE